MSSDGKGLIKEPLEVLKEYFGHTEFLDGQEEVISQVLQGKDGLAVMPTGGGKSLCYQLPALCFSGVSLVISPLIALMKDQVDALVEKGIPATLINSTIGWTEQKERMDAMVRGEYKLVYVAPERFRTESFLRALEKIEISLFAVDEAHCLSQWGHDFRPDYMRLGQALEKSGSPQCVAFTATATPRVRHDIREVLRLREPFEIVSGFARPNLSFVISQVDGHQQKYKRIEKILKEYKTGIIYCATRKRVEEVSETLASWGVSVVAYHGGMGDEERARVQEVFLQKKADVAVATNAFGMGIDRPDVRFVIHFELPGSIEAYYQEAGRAGRDGEAGVCELLFNYADTRTQEFFIEGANPGVEVIRRLYHYLLQEADGEYELHLSIKEMADGIGVKNSMAVSSALVHLLRGGYIQRFDIPGKRRRGTRLLQPELSAEKLQLDVAALEEKERRDRDKLKAMVEMCYGKGCRQRWILEYFGETNAENCGSCDICLTSSNHEERSPTEAEHLIVRKALSGVARMSRRTKAGWEGKFGRGKMVLMLLGSRSKDILNARLDRLSTYGILSDLSSGYVNGLFRSLLEAGLLRVELGEYPLVTLSARGEEVMRGSMEYRLVWPDQRSSKETTVSELKDHGFDPNLYEALKNLRQRMSKAQRVPPYVIFSNKTLEAFCRYRPRTLEEGLQVPGVGEIKAQRYLRGFLDIINGQSNAPS